MPAHGLCALTLLSGSAQNISGDTDTTVAYNTTLTAAGGLVKSGSGVRVPVADTYQISVTYFGGASTDSQVKVRVMVNGAQQREMFASKVVGIPYSTLQATVPLPLAANDLVTIQIRTDLGVALSAEGNRNTLTVEH